MDTEKDASLETLQEIRSIMERSARFLSLSGWSGIWAGCVALLGGGIAGSWLHEIQKNGMPYTKDYFLDPVFFRFLFLGLLIFIAALGGGFFFTYKKVKRQGSAIWNAASRRFVIEMLIPLFAGAVFVSGFLLRGHAIYIAATCLVFYGLSLINASKYTLADIRYLGITEILLGCISIYFPGYGLYFWCLGFGMAHIIYGIIMWNKYDKKETGNTIA